MGASKHLTTFDLYRLHLAVQPIVQAFPCKVGSRTYLVGSVERKGEPYRDVDVRTILDDQDFDRMFGHSRELWAAFCLGMSAWLVQQTGLPIDYQVQRLTEANDKHDGPRNPLGGRGREFAGGGDATHFQPRCVDCRTVLVDGGCPCDEQPQTCGDPTCCPPAKQDLEVSDD